MINIVTIGGGTGHNQVLTGLKYFSDLKITAICPSTDSGGSTGVLQADYNGFGYTGDLTKCLLALTENDELAKALGYRFSGGSLNGHSVKNLFFHSLVVNHGLVRALDLMKQILDIGPHQVLPVTKEKTQLNALLNFGHTVFGEANIDNLAKNPLWSPTVHSIKDIYLKPHVSASPEVKKSLVEADYVVVCPGDLYSSIIPVLIPRGMKESIQKSSAQIVLFLNIMTKQGETDNYLADDFINRIEKYLGKKVDYIIYNNKPIPKGILLNYSLEHKVEFKKDKSVADNRIIKAPLAYISSDGKILTNPAVIAKVFRSIIFPLPKPKSPPVYILDLDDTLFDSTNQPPATKKSWPLKLLTGVEEFLSNNRGQKILVTMGGAPLQKRKLAALKIEHSFDEIFIVKTNQEKLAVLKELAGRYKSNIVVIGNRIDSEIKYGNALGLKTVLIKFGKYQDLVSTTYDEYPDVTIENFRDLPKM